MKNKLILEEDELISTEEVVEEDPVLPKEQPEEVTISVNTSIISELIKMKWDLIDYCNSILINPEFEGGEVLDMIINDEYIHIGQLEKLLQNSVPAAENIDTAKEEA